MVAIWNQIWRWLLWAGCNILTPLLYFQYAIVFKTPPYKDTSIDKPVNVLIMLQRKTDTEASDPKSFTFYPQPHGKLKKMSQAQAYMKFLKYNRKIVKYYTTNGSYRRQYLMNTLLVHFYFR